MRTFLKSPRLLILVLLCGFAFAAPSWGEPVTITEPVMRYGLGQLECAVYTSDGKYIAGGGAIGAAIWEADTGEQVRVLTSPGHWVCSMAFSPSGGILLTGGQRDAKLWDLSTGVVLRTLPVYTKVTSVAFSPDGSKVLTGTASSGASVWNAATGTFIRSLSASGGIAFSADGTRFLVGNTLHNAVTYAAIRTFSLPPSTSATSVAFSPDGTKALLNGILFNVATGTQIREFVSSSWYLLVVSSAFSQDGTKVLTGHDDQTAALWNASTGALIRRFSHAGVVNCVAFSPDGTKAMTGSGGTSWFFSRRGDNTIRLWDTTVNPEVRTFTGPAAAQAVAISPDGTKIAAGYSDGNPASPDNSAVLWDAASGAKLGTLTYTRGNYTSGAVSAAFSPDGSRLLTGNRSQTYSGQKANLWDLSTNAEIRFFDGNLDTVCSVAFSSDGTKILTASSGGNELYPAGIGMAKIWDGMTGGTEIRTFSGHAGPVHSAALSPDGTKVLTGSEDKTARLWNAATEDGITTFTGHTSAVYSVAFSRDGTKVLTGSADYTAKLWNASTGDLITTFSGHAGPVYSAALSPDGTKVLTGSSDCSAKLWDASTGAEIRTFSGHTSVVPSVAFSPDGTKVLTGSYDNTAKLWNASTGTEIRTFSGHTGAVYSVAFSPDGTKVLTGSVDYTAKLWNASTGAEIRTFSHTWHVISVAFSPDGTKVLTGSYDNTAKLWNASTGEVIQTFSRHDSVVCSVAFSRDGTKALTGSSDQTARLWTVGGAAIRTITGHSGGIHSAALSRDGTKVLTGGVDTSVTLWSADTGARLRTWENPFGVSSYGEIYAVALSPDGAMALAGGYYGAKVLNTSTGALVRAFEVQEVRSVAFSPDGKMVLLGSGASSNRGTLWDLATGQAVTSLCGHTDKVLSVCFSGDGAQAATASADKTVKLWSIADTRELRSFSGYRGPINSVSFSPDGAKVLMGGGYSTIVSSPLPNVQDGTAKLLDTSTGEVLQSFVGHSKAITSVAISPDATGVLTGSLDNQARHWNASTGAPIRSFWEETTFDYPVHSVAYSPDGTKVLTGADDNSAKLWNASNGALILYFVHNGPVYAVAYSPNGTRVLTGAGSADGNKATLWDASTGASVQVFEGHTGAINSVAFSPDGTKALTGSDDCTARLWDVSTGAEVKSFDCGFQVNSVAISPSGKKILTGSRSGSSDTAKFILWSVDSGEKLRTYAGHTGEGISLSFSKDGTRIVSGGGEDGLALLWDSGDRASVGGGTPPSASTRKLDKLLLVAGGGGYAGNPIAAQTKALAELAHVTATVRGYTPENILYLSAFETPAQNPRVDAAASADAITSAVLDWASDARRLTMMLIDHGEYDPGIPEWYFLVDGTKTPRNFLTASALDAALNTAQSGADPLPELCVYVDMCYAGGFVKKLSAAPAGMQRIVIASTTSDRLANFGGGDSGGLSFTGFFLSSALLGRTLEDCFGLARTTIVALNLPSAAPQTPWLDDDGDNQFTKSDGAVAGRHVFGSHPAFGLLPPEITAARATQNLPAPADCQVWLELGPGPVKRAQAVVSSTADYYPGGVPITNVKTYDLAHMGVTQRWSGTIPKADLRNDTRYTIVYVAYRDDGFGLDIASEPRVSFLGVGTRAEVPKERWELYD
jgi:WD40 repeat protein